MLKEDLFIATPLLLSALANLYYYPRGRKAVRNTTVSYATLAVLSLFPLLSRLAAAAVYRFLLLAKHLIVLLTTVPSLQNKALVKLFIVLALKTLYLLKP